MANEILEHRIKNAVKARQDDQIERATLLLADILNDYPGDAEAVFELADCYKAQNQFGVAAILYASVLNAVPNHTLAWNNLGVCQKMIGSVETALPYFEQALERGASKDLVYGNIANLYACHGMYDEALDYADKSLDASKVPAANDAANMVKACCLLAQRDWSAGWHFYRARYNYKETDAARVKLRTYTKNQTPVWDGSPGKTIVVHGEQGLGDEIMFCSTIPELIKMSKKVIIHCTPRLETLFARSFPEADVYGGHEVAGTWWQTQYDIDCVAPMGMLPYYLRKTSDDFPAHGGYLRVNEDLYCEYRERLESLGPGPYVGLSWIGGIAKTWIKRRSFPLDMYQPIIEQPGTFVSLQYTGGAGKEAQELGYGIGKTIHHWQDVINDFDKLTALIAALDLVITVPQTAYHQAGAVNTPAWVITPSKADWHEGSGKESPWYPNQVKFIRRDESPLSDTIKSVAEQYGQWSKLLQNMPPQETVSQIQAPS